MKTYVGIDLGTTNSVVCTYDGKETHVLKSPDQNDVTPSAIYVDRRGRRFLGRKAFEMAPGNEKNSATLFKRFLGTDKTFSLGENGTEMTPVECSAELLRYLFNYLPEEIQKDPETYTVITVPAAFNQVKKDATLEAARLAGIGRTALMQEPVAAVMSVLKKDNEDRSFIVYDLGGGTFDVSVAEHTVGRVSLLAQGGREMCGGRDWDLWIFEEKIVPWLKKQFDLPEDFAQEADYARLRRQALFAAEQAKIALSRADSVIIQADEEVVLTQDLSGVEIYLDIPFTRADLEPVVTNTVEQTCEVTREVMKSAGVSSSDIAQIVFVGGPSAYLPLQEAVAAELHIPLGEKMNPMTAVAEGASIYAESLDWDKEVPARKETLASHTIGEGLKVNYESRTASDTGRIAIIADDEEERSVTVESEDGEYSAEPVTFTGRTMVQVPVTGTGEHAFLLTICKTNASEDEPVKERVVITGTLASVQSIPASHSIAVKALRNLDGETTAVYLIHANDPLPKEGSVTFRAGKKLLAGSDGSLLFTLWEGEISDPVEDNRYIGTFRIPGADLPSGIVNVGDEIICDYQVEESGTIRLGVRIPSIGYSASQSNYYSSMDGKEELSNAEEILLEANRLLQRVTEIAQKITDIRLFRTRKNLQRVRQTAQHSEDPEALQGARSTLLECRKAVAYIRKDHLREMRKMELDRMCNLFEAVRYYASPAGQASFDNLKESAEIAIRTGSADFETLLKEMNHTVAQAQWNNDNIVELHYDHLVSRPGDFEDKAAFEDLRRQGAECIRKKDYHGLRVAVNKLYGIQTEKRPQVNSEMMLEEVNVIV